MADTGGNGPWSEIILFQRCLNPSDMNGIVTRLFDNTHGTVARPQEGVRWSLVLQKIRNKKVKFFQLYYLVILGFRTAMFQQIGQETKKNISGGGGY